MLRILAIISNNSVPSFNHTDWITGASHHSKTDSISMIDSVLLLFEILTSSFRYRHSVTCLKFSPKNFKNLEILAKNGVKKAPAKNCEFFEIFAFSRNFLKSGGPTPNLRRSGRAHRVFQGYFYHFLAIFRVYLLLKGIVPKKSKILDFGKKRWFFRKNQRFLPKSRIFDFLGTIPFKSK